MRACAVHACIDLCMHTRDTVATVAALAATLFRPLVNISSSYPRSLGARIRSSRLFVLMQIFKETTTSDES